MLSGLDQRVKFYQSDYVTEKITSFINSTTVPGLAMVPILNVLEVLRNEGCPVYIFGGTVRDQFLGIAPDDIDLETDCNISTIVNICRKEWGSENCGKENDTITHVGRKYDHRAIDVGSTSSTFYAPLANLEYTANSIAYTIDSNLILDITGRGVADACVRKIRIPSNDESESSWNKWSSALKLFRYWKLRYKGFVPHNNATKNYILQSVKREIESETPPYRSLKKFYCVTVYGISIRYSSSQNKCQASGKVCENASEKALKYNMLFMEDLGVDYVSQNITLPTCGDY